MGRPGLVQGVGKPCHLVGFLGCMGNDGFAVTQAKRGYSVTYGTNPVTRGTSIYGAGSLLREDEKTRG